MFCHATLLLLTVSAACADSAIVKGGARIAKNQNKERKDKQKLAKASNMISIANEDEQNDGMVSKKYSILNPCARLFLIFMVSSSNNNFQLFNHFLPRRSIPCHSIII